MHSQLQAKRVSIRKARRREELQQLFANKRKLLLQTNITQDESSVYLLDLFHELEAGANLQKTIHRMMNSLAQQKPFLRYNSDGCPEQQTIIKFCLDLSELVLGKIICNYRTDNKIDNYGRINCLGIIINLLADENCPNHLLAPSVAHFLRQTYNSVEIWGIDKQIIQVGWLLGNLISNNQIVMADNTIIQYLLQWVQELCQLKDQHMLMLIYRGMSRLIPALQKYYQLDKHQLPEIHKSRIINIIALTVQNNIKDYSPNTLIAIISFITTSFSIMAALCPYILNEAAIRKSIPFMGSISKRLMREVCKLCILSLKGLSAAEQVSLCDRCQRVREVIQKLRLLMTDDYSNKLLTLLCMKELDMKVELLGVILALIKDNSHSSYIVGVFLRTGLEDILINIADSGHQEVIIGCFQVVEAILRHTQGQQGQKFITAMEKLNSQKFKEMNHNLKDFYHNGAFQI